MGVYEREDRHTRIMNNYRGTSQDMFKQEIIDDYVKFLREVMSGEYRPTENTETESAESDGRSVPMPDSVVERRYTWEDMTRDRHTRIMNNYRGTSHDMFKQEIIDDYVKFLREAMGKGRPPARANA